MNGRLAIRAILAVFVITAPGWLRIRECRAGSIKSIIDNNNGMFTSGKLTFTFTDKSLTVDPATLPATSIFTPPTLETVDVSAVAGGVMFTFDTFLSLTTPDPITQNITISYSVKAAVGIAAAGLSFSGLAVDINTKSAVTETFAGRNEMLDVFSMQNADGKTTEQKSRSTLFADTPMTLDVTNSAVLSTGVRGNGEKSTAQLSSITNTFTLVPEPANLINAAAGVLFALGAWYRNARR